MAKNDLQADLVFRVGSKVEITSPLHRLQGTLFPGKIIGISRKKKTYLVEYETLMKQRDCTVKPQTENVGLGLLRPAPLPESKKEFKCDDLVDAFFNGGWWEGFVTKEVKKLEYLGYFRCIRRHYRFGASQLRIHREWIKGVWVPAFQDKDGVKYQEGVKDQEAPNEKDSQPAETSGIEKSKGPFSRGDLVEVKNDEEGFEGAWFAATIIDRLGGDKILIEYLHLTTENNEGNLREEARFAQLRPHPPQINNVDLYDRYAKVDVLFNEGWWEGVVIQVLDGMRYLVYFEGTKDDMVCLHKDLRPHQDWVDGRWVC